jgi:hypothetical protein
MLSLNVKAKIWRFSQISYTLFCFVLFFWVKIWLNLPMDDRHKKKRKEKKPLKFGLEAVLSYRKRGNSFLPLFGSFFSASCFCPHARSRSLARTPVLSLPPPSLPPLPRTADVAAVAVLLVLGDAGRNGLFFLRLVCCWEYSGSCVLVGLLSGFIWFSTGLRACLFLGGGGVGVGVDLCFVLFSGLCSVLLVSFWSREDDEYGGRQGGSGLGTIVFSSG